MDTSSTDRFFSGFTDIRPPRGFKKDDNTKMFDNTSDIKIDISENKPQTNIFDNKMTNAGIEPPPGFQDPENSVQNMLDMLNEKIDTLENSPEETNTNTSSKFDDKTEFVNELNNEYKKQLKQRGLNENYSVMLVAQDYLECGGGKKVKGKNNFGNIAGGDKGYGYYKSSDGHKFTNYMSMSDYVSDKLDLLSNDRYNFFNSFSPTSNVAITMQVLADRGYCPNSPNYGKKVAEVCNTVVKNINTGTSSNSAPKMQNIISTARQYVGDPYVWGGKSPSKGFDCSGLLSYAYKTNGVNLPGSTSGIFKYGKEVPSLSQAKVGDIICTPGNGASGRHVKMISQIKDGKIWTIEAKGKKYGIVESPLTTSDNIITIRRIVS